MIRAGLRNALAWRGARVAFVGMLSIGMLLGLTDTRQTSAYTFELSEGISNYEGLSAVVTYSGNGVHLRSQPSIDSDVLAKVPEGTEVALRVDSVHTVYDVDGDRWWPVSVDGVDGWIIGSYLDGLQLDATAASSSAITPQFASGAVVEVVTDDGGNVRMRIDVGADTEEIGKLPFGDIVEIVAGPFADDNGDGWYLVDTGDKRAYVIGMYLEEVGTAPVTTGEFSRGDFASADGELNVRSGPSIGDGIVGELDGGALVEIVGGPYVDTDGDGWYLIESDDLEGYAIANFLLAAEEPDTGPVTGSYIYPLASYRFTQAFGCSPFAFEPYDAAAGCNYHNGIDLAAAAYTPIRAAEGGTIAAAEYCNCGLGYYVEIDHGDGVSSIYGHMAEMPYVSVGEVVEQGEVIGPVGSSGISTGPHVHFMIEVDGVAVDPMKYL